jgi:hypothetical protein
MVSRAAVIKTAALPPCLPDVVMPLHRAYQIEQLLQLAQRAVDPNSRRAHVGGLLQTGGALQRRAAKDGELTVGRESTTIVTSASASAARGLARAA